MLLTGTYSRTLDEKHRFSIPKPLRDALQNTNVETLETKASSEELGAGSKGGRSDRSGQVAPPMFLTPGTDGSLALYPESVLSEIGGRLGGHSPNETDVRAFSRLFYAQAHRVDLDRQGRVRLPAELVRWANIQREIVVLGVHDHIEVWERSRWEGYLDSNQMRFDEIAEQAFRPSGPSESQSIRSDSTGAGRSHNLSSKWPR